MEASHLQNHICIDNKALKSVFVSITKICFSQKENYLSIAMKLDI